MSAVMTPPAPPSAPRPQPSISKSSAGGWRSAKSAIATVLIVMSLVVAMVPLVLIVGYVIVRGIDTISWAFLTDDIPILSRSEGPGMGPAVVGTLLITGAATVMAVPLGVLGGIYLNEYSARSAFGRSISFLAEVMTGVPSIVMGLFVYSIWVLRFGVSGFAGALALACLMLPVVIRTTEETLKLVAADLRESAYALGGRKAGTILRVVLPAAAPGIVSGALLAVARAAGETAPLLFTILTVNETNTDLFHGPNTTLSVQIFRNAQQVFHRSAGAGLGRRAHPDRHRVRVHPPFPRPGGRVRKEAPRMSLVDDRSQPMDDLDVTPTNVAPVTEGVEELPEGDREVVFEIRDGSVRYGANLAVADVNFDVGAREITAIIGPSGCGKSTFLRCLNRMNDFIPGAKVGGRITYHGEDLYDSKVDAAEVRRRIGMVFQKPNPFPKSIFDNVAYGPRINRFKGDMSDLVEQALTRAALWDEVKDKLKKSAYALSGGQQQRLCIARTLAVQPDVVLMDEPCSALDPIATSRIEDLMVQLKRDFTIVIVTHNMQQAARVSDMTAFFTTDVAEDSSRVGRLVEFDRTHTIFTSPSDQRTEGYITGRFG